jgi:hypothetical protein
MRVRALTVSCLDSWYTLFLVVDLLCWLVGASSIVTVDLIDQSKHLRLGSRPKLLVSLRWLSFSVRLIVVVVFACLLVIVPVPCRCDGHVNVLRSSCQQSSPVRYHLISIASRHIIPMPAVDDSSHSGKCPSKSFVAIAIIVIHPNTGNTSTNPSILPGTCKISFVADGGASISRAPACCESTTAGSLVWW